MGWEPRKLTEEEHAELRIRDMDAVQSAIEGLSSKNMFIRTECVDTLGSYCQNSEYHEVCVAAAQALTEARGHEDERVADAAIEWLKGLRDHNALPRGFIIKPHKGGRTHRLYARVAPEVKAFLENHVKERGITIADWLEQKAKEEMNRPK